MWNSKEKNKFRLTSLWRSFSKQLKKQQKTDPITGAKLTKYCQCHHLDPYIYYELLPEKFVVLNPKSHELIELIFKSKNRWRYALKAIEQICKKMEEYQKKYSDSLNQGIFS
jgi:hypothetical protein